MRTKIILNSMCLAWIALMTIFWLQWKFSNTTAIIYIIIMICFLIFFYFCYNSLHRKIIEVTPDLYTRQCYKWTRFLWPNEKDFYRTLYKILHREYWERYIIFSQVRMKDMFERRSKLYPWVNWSVDFLIVDFEDNFKPIVAIELDWDNHKKDPHQKELDIVKNKLFSISPIHLIRIDNADKNNEYYIFDEIITEIEAKRTKNVK